jgi:hypothetical protein
MIAASLSLLGLSLATLAVPACGSDSTPSTPATDMVVGAMLPRTGPNANTDWVSAVELAVLDMNTALSMAKSKMVKPINFKINELDTASVEQTAFDAMGTFLTAGAKIVVTEASNAAIGGNKANYAATGDDGRLPLISFTATSATLNKADAVDAEPTRQAALQDLDNWFFRTCQISDALSAIRLRSVFSASATSDSGGNGDVNGDGRVRVVWIGTSDTSTQASITGDRKAFDTYVATLPAGSPTYVAETVTFDPGTTPEGFDYTAPIALATDNFLGIDTTLDMGAPDLIINKALTNVAIPFIKAYKQNTANTTAIFQDGSFRRNSLLASLGATADGQRGVSNIAYMNNASGTIFKTEQQAVTGWAPAAYESQGYDAMALALLSMVKASITAGDPLAVTSLQTRDALTTLNTPGALVIRTGATELKKGIEAIIAGTAINYEGASGTVDFDAVGNVKNLAVLWQIEGGQFVEKQTFDCVTSADCPALTP